MIATLTLPLLERVINRCLQTDLQALAKLQALEGKVIQLNITDWQFNCFIIPKHHGIELQTQWPTAADTLISGTLEHLFKVGIATDKSTAIKQHQIQFQGDIHIGMAMQQLLASLDIDWAALLANKIGDAPAHMITTGLDAIRLQGRAFIQSFRQNSADYIHHEAKLCPTNTALETFYQDIAQLRDDVDRLEAKIAQHKRSSPPE